MGAYKEEKCDFLHRQIDWTRGNIFKVKEKTFTLDVKKKFFIVRKVRHWNRLLSEIVDGPNLEVFKIRLDQALSNLI